MLRASLRFEPLLPIADIQLSMEHSEAPHTLITTETCDPTLSVNVTGGNTDAVGLGVSGNPPVTNGDLDQAERALLLDQESEKVKTSILDLTVSDQPPDVILPESQPQITVTNLTGNVDDEVICSIYWHIITIAQSCI